MRKLHVFLPCVFSRRKCFTPTLVKHTRVGSNWVNGVMIGKLFGRTGKALRNPLKLHKIRSGQT